MADKTEKSDDEGEKEVKPKDKKSKKTEEEDKAPEKEKGNGAMTIAVIIIIVLLAGYVYMGVTGNSIFPVQQNSENSKIKIGFMGPLTGDAASYGHGIKRGVDLALKDSGLTNVKIIYEDTKCDGKETVNAINKLINIDGVVAIVGEVCSGATLAAAPIAEESKIVLITPSSTSSEITKSGDYIFRTIPSDTLQGKFAANLIYGMNITNLSILYGNEEYGIGLKDSLKADFEALGGSVVSTEAFERSSTDLRTQITKIRKSRPQALYIVSNSPDSAVAALKQIKQLGLRVKLFGSEGLKAIEVSNEKSAQGLIITSVSAGTTTFATEYYNEYGLAAEPFSPQGYDSFTALAKTLKEGALTGDTIKEDLYKLEFDGASGKIAFDNNGDVSGNYDVYKLENKTFVLQ